MFCKTRLVGASALVKTSVSPPAKKVIRNLPVTNLAGGYHQFGGWMICTNPNEYAVFQRKYRVFAWFYAFSEAPYLLSTGASLFVSTVAGTSNDAM